MAGLDGLVLGNGPAVDEDGDLVRREPQFGEQFGVGGLRDVELVRLAADDLEAHAHSRGSAAHDFSLVVGHQR